jgi:hypothetical protein
MKKIKPNYLFICLIPILFSCMKGKKVDQIFHNASIFCLDDNNTTGEAMAIANGKIVEIGPERQILNKYRSEESIDVEGREIVPTFSDCNLQIDTIEKWSLALLEEIETQELEQGIVEVFIHGVNNNKLLELAKFGPNMQVIWHVYLTPSKENVNYIRNIKKKKKFKNLIVAGFTISNDNKSTVLEACAVTKSNSLQIGIDFHNGQLNIPLIIQSLQNYKLDHRWFVFNIHEMKKLKTLEMNNFFICFNESNKNTLPIYLFGSSQTSDKLLERLSNYSKLNKLELMKTLKSITNWAQYLSFSEKRNGTLEKGKNANFTILDTPISKRNEYNAIYSKATYLKGKQIYSME